MGQSEEFNEAGYFPRPHRRRDPAFWKYVIMAAFNRRLALQDSEHRPTRLAYPGESITWEQCDGLGGRLLECSSIDVPSDQSDAAISGNRTFSIPLIRMRGNHATQNLLLNPAGPEGSGIEFIYRRGEQLRDIVGEGFHLFVRNNRAIEDSVEAYTWSHNFDRACTDTMGAADMNSILGAVGQDGLVCWGFSYGTILGQTVIVDGVANQFIWHEGLLDSETLIGTENVWEGFLKECFKAGKDYALSSLAASEDSLRAKLFSFVEKPKDNPLSVYVNNTVYGTVDYETLIQRTHKYIPRVGVKTAHHLLILSTTYDPVCPLQSARSANAALDGSKIVEVQEYGYYSLSTPSTCLAKRVREFLYHGTLPESYEQCEVDGPYFAKPEEDGMK
ncbi:hypothetical protein F5Y06DRAFT_307293 [Hypoxylon sp. FL0890]|nr:hypothetical protein F5Y06DRAFT_307293 [Hypoxylon sp. FL0890]